MPNADILKNAILSIQLGIEDFLSNDERRPVSALRNFYAGVLLLGKQCLLGAAPAADPMDVLASKFVPVLNGRGELVHVPKGYQTIDLAELRDRFKNFNLDWPAGNIKNLQKLRNDFEHYHSQAPKEVIREAIADCFTLVEGFFSILGRSPKASLGDAWDVMLAEKAFFDKLKEECNATFNEIDWWGEITDRSEIRCATCGSSLIYQADEHNSDPAEIEGRCKACGEEMTAEQTVEILVEAQFGEDAYLAAKEGADPVIHSCPECANETYVGLGETVKCFFCDYSIDESCARCGTSLTASNISVNNPHLCDYCDHVSSRDD